MILLHQIELDEIDLLAVEKKDYHKLNFENTKQARISRDCSRNWTMHQAPQICILWVVYNNLVPYREERGNLELHVLMHQPVFDAIMHCIF